MEYRYLQMPIHINGIEISKVGWKASALKHFKKSADYLIDIAISLDNQKDLPLFYEGSSDPYYKTASATSALMPCKAESNFRDSCFRIDEDEKMLIFFHLGYIKNEKAFDFKASEINRKRHT